MRSSFWLACCTALLMFAGPAPTRAATGEARGTDMQLTVLSKGDIALYLDVMRAAAARLRHPSAGDKALQARSDAIKAAIRAGKKTSLADMRLVEDANKLAYPDAMIVDERHIDRRRFIGIATVIEDIVHAPPGKDMVVTTGRGAPADSSAASTRLRQQIKAVEAKDAPLLAPHRAEIQQLMTLVRHTQPAA